MDIEKVRIILADDEDNILLYLKTLLSKAGCEVVGQARNGCEVLALYREKRPDMVIMDINMPFQTGEETLAQLKTEFPEALVIMLTSVADAPEHPVGGVLKIGFVSPFRVPEEFIQTESRVAWD